MNAVNSLKSLVRRKSPPWFLKYYSIFHDALHTDIPLIRHYKERRILERYMNNTYNVDPDFFVVSPHGAGLQSFLYYINLIGIPSSSWSIPTSFPILKGEPLAIGMTCDKVLQNPFPCPTRERNIFWLIRDPVLLLRAGINQMLGDKIRCGRFKKRDIEHHLEHILDKNNISHYIMYSSQLNSVPVHGKIYAVDTSDISGEKCIRTMNTIASLYKKTISDDHAELLTVPYNNFQNRIFRDKNKIAVDIEARHYLRVCPSNIYDFHFNQWKKRFIVDEFSLNGRDFTLFADNYSLMSLKKHTDINAVINNTTSILLEIDKFIKTYEDQLLHEDELISIIKNNNKYYDVVMNILKDELKMVRKIAPEKMENWHSYQKLDS